MNPWCIAIQNDNLYVSDINKHTVFYFKLPDMKLIQRVGKEGTGNLEFNQMNWYKYILVSVFIAKYQICKQSYSIHLDFYGEKYHNTSIN